jgi:hypothetical protein
LEELEQLPVSDPVKASHEAIMVAHAAGVLVDGVASDDVIVVLDVVSDVVVEICVELMRVSTKLEVLLDRV